MGSPPLLDTVLGNLCIRDQAKFSLVCREWRDKMPYRRMTSVDFDCFWDDINGADASISVTTDQQLMHEVATFVFKAAGPHRLRRVIALDCDYDYIPRRIVHQVAHHCPCLEELSVDAMPLDYLPRFPQLSHLTVNNFLLTDDTRLSAGEFFAALQKLTYLQVRMLSFFGSSSRKRGRGRVVGLPINGRNKKCGGGGRGARALAGERRSALVNYMVRHVALDALRVCGIGDSDDFTLTDDGLRTLCANCSGIEDIDISSDALTSIEPVCGLSRLTALSVRYGAIRDGSGLTAVSQVHGRTLKKLVILRPESLTDFAFLRNLIVLKRLSLTVPNFGVEDLFQLSVEAPLKNLLLFNTRAGTDEGIRLLIDRGYPIQRLFLDYTFTERAEDRITPAGITAIFANFKLTAFQVTGLQTVLSVPGLVDMLVTSGAGLDYLMLDSSVLTPPMMAEFFKKRASILEEDADAVCELYLESEKCLLMGKGEHRITDEMAAAALIETNVCDSSWF